MNSNHEHQMVYLKDICSLEYYEFKDKQRKQVLKDICMEGFQKESWAFLGDTAFELRLLLEIIANARRYEKGTCILAQIGMMRKKKLILPHVFYIGSTNMLFEHMHVLEYLKMINMKMKKNPYQMEKDLLQDLIDAGLGYISLSHIGSLSAQEKAIFTLFTSLYMDSSIVIMNLARLTFSSMEIKCLQYISSRLREQGKIFLFSTMDPNIAQGCASHIVVLHDGQSLYHGDINTFMIQYDHQILHLEDPKIQVIYDILAAKFPDCEFISDSSSLDVFCKEKSDWCREQMIGVLHQFQKMPRIIIQTQPSLANAWKERKRVYEQAI